MRVKTLVAGLTDLVKELGVEGWREFRTPDGTRIDYAITQGPRRLLAVEFERSRKWLFARVLYNAVKAQRAEFPAVLFVYPYYDLPRAGRSWVPNYVEDTLGLRIALCHPRDCLLATQTLIAEQLNLPSPPSVAETDCVITTIGGPKKEANTLKVGADAWRQLPSPTTKKQPKRKRSPRTRKRKKSK